MPSLSIRKGTVQSCDPATTVRLQCAARYQFDGKLDKAELDQPFAPLSRIDCAAAGEIKPVLNAYPTS